VPLSHAAKPLSFESKSQIQSKNMEVASLTASTAMRAVPSSTANTKDWPHAPIHRLSELLKQLHGETATEVNRLDEQPGRQVWFNFRETQLTFQKSYLARLNYVHQNAVKHGLVRVANQYRWCSAAWFERTATPAQVKSIYTFPTAKVKVQDDYDPACI